MLFMPDAVAVPHTVAQTAESPLDNAITVCVVDAALITGNP